MRRAARKNDQLERNAAAPSAIMPAARNTTDSREIGGSAPGQDSGERQVLNPIMVLWSEIMSSNTKPARREEEDTCVLSLPLRFR